VEVVPLPHATTYFVKCVFVKKKKFYNIDYQRSLTSTTNEVADVIITL